MCSNKISNNTHTKAISEPTKLSGALECFKLTLLLHLGVGVKGSAKRSRFRVIDKEVADVDGLTLNSIVLICGFML